MKGEIIVIDGAAEDGYAVALHPGVGSELLVGGDSYAKNWGVPASTQEHP